MISKEEIKSHITPVINFSGVPEDMCFYLDKDKNLSTSHNLTSEEFEKLATPYTKVPFRIKDFYPRLKNILQYALRLQSLGLYCRYQFQHLNDEIQRLIQQDYQNEIFQVIMPDAMSLDDFYKRDFLINTCKDKKYPYLKNKEALTLIANVPTREFLATSLKHPYLIKANFADAQLNMDRLKKNPDLLMRLTEVENMLCDFYNQTPPPYTQQQWQKFWMTRTYENAETEAIKGCDAPLIMYLADNTRRFLTEVLIQEHHQDIAPTKQQAQQRLKQNKNAIFLFGQKFNYISDAAAYIHCENLRNELAHDRNTVRFGEKANVLIADLYMDFVSHFIDRQFLSEYSKTFPDLFKLQEIPGLYNSYEIIRRSAKLDATINELLPEELKSKSTKEKIKFLMQQKLLSKKEVENAEELFLKRNPIAHGQSDKIIQQERKTIPSVDNLCHNLIFRQKNQRNN